MKMKGRYCDCPQPTWISGMMHVDTLDADAVHQALKEEGREGPRDQDCDRPYHPDVSFDPYA